jgi:hypothetical protein
MIILLHVVVALASLAYSTYLFFRPSQAGLRTSYVLVAATLISGTYLVWSTHSPMLQSCVAGVAYLGIVSFGLAGAHMKLAAAKHRA